MSQNRKLNNFFLPQVVETKKNLHEDHEVLVVHGSEAWFQFFKLGVDLLSTRTV